MEQVTALLDYGIASRIAFSVVFIALMLIFMYSFFYRMQLMLLAKKADVRWDQIPKRIGMALKFGIGQYKMPQEFLAGFLHIAVFYGFLTVSLRTIMLTIVLVIGDSDFHLWFLGPDNIVGQLYILGKDVMTVTVITAVLVLMYRRIVSPPKRFEGAHNYEAAAILLWIFTLMFTDYLVEVSQIAIEQNLGLADHMANYWFMPFAALGAKVFGGIDNETLAWVWKVNVWIHICLVWTFLNYLPYGKHFHVITAIPNVFFGRLDPVGKLQPVHDIEEEFEKEEPSIGVREVNDLSWKHIFDMYTCTECGRCAPQCPAFDTGKPLSMRDVNLSLKKYLLDKGPHLLGKNKNPEGKEVEYDGPEQLTGQGISTETIWACTLCRDCEERCPVLIEQIPRIVDMRRYLVLMEGDMPNELNNLFKGFERNSNPWNLGMDKRGDWITEDDPIPMMAELEPEAQKEIEYLYYVGCMGSYDDRSIKITKAFCKIMAEAGVKVAVLGSEESCCGETARRLGNEYLGQIMMQMLVETINQYPIKKIVTTCPHCFNTLKHEYPEFGGDWEVTHANDLLLELINSGKIKLENKIEGSLTYHDSCFLGRYNNQYDQPREILTKLGMEVKETERNKSQGYCCGAGGGRMWLEEDTPRVNNKRFEEIWKQEPKLIGTSCPYCNTMLTDGSKAEEKEDDVKVKDLVELVLEGMGK